MEPSCLCCLFNTDILCHQVYLWCWKMEVATYATVFKNASRTYFGLSPNSQWMSAIFNFVPLTYVFPLCLSSRCDPSFVFFRRRECLSYMFLSPTSYANILGCYLKVKPKGLYAQESIMLCPTSKYLNGWNRWNALKDYTNPNTNWEINCSTNQIYQWPLNLFCI